MSYIDEKGRTQYTLKEKYEYYKNKANSSNSTNTFNGKKIPFIGRVALANKANSIKRKMRKVKK